MKAQNKYLEVMLMKVKELIRRIKSPCPKCPYKLELVYTVTNLCPQCRLNGYQSYEWFQKQLSEKL